MHAAKTKTGLALLILLGLGAGCTSLMDKRTESEIRRDRVRDLLKSENRPTLIKQVATPRQLSFAAIKNIGLVTHLAETGGPVSPSAQREKILDAMRRNDVPDPNRLLDSKQTTMVIATSPIPPAAQAGERHNVIVQLSTHSQASDLRQGWLRETPLMEIGQFEGQVKTSFDYAKAEGSLVTNAQYSGQDDPESKVQAVVVGGARLLKSRDVGLGVIADYADAVTMAAVIPAINQRFTYFDGSSQKGVAVPMSDEYVNLHIPARYKLDPYHFVNVVEHIGFNESADQRSQRVERLTAEVCVPATVRTACWQLEAIGESAADILAAHLADPDPEIRFYCAHSLAYLGDHRAVPALHELAMTQSAFRLMCLNGLTVLENYQAEEALKDLLNCEDPEARYGAVRALKKRNARDPLVTPHQVSKVGGLLEIPTSNSPLIAVSMYEVPEVVSFGTSPQLSLPPFHNVNPNILIQPSGSNEVTVSRFAPDQDDAIVKCPSDLLSVLDAIGQVGGGYGDWVSFVRECRDLGFMPTSVAMNPVPTTGRTFDRELGASVDANELENDTTEIVASEPVAQATWYKPWTWWAE